ncbi:ParA family protein [Nocardia brasiliensis]|uniref:ParA family protein n=1 Tax=Nocardia brasiliensis TaxID=37326 RepID=UPI002457C3C1|nr:AAA family ATPase [Nocardia brasiliensis]
MATSQPAPARVIAIALQKGGVGKTTTTINLAAALTGFGLQVLVIDMDPQANTTSGLGIELGPDDATMYEVLHLDRDQRVQLTEIIKKSEFGIHVAPGHLALKELERTGLGSGGQMRLARQLDTLEGYDYVLLDCPPALGELTTAALAAADDALTPVGPGPDELGGLIDLGKTILDVQEELNPDIEIRYLIVCGYDGRNQLSKDVKNRLRADWGDWDDGGAYLGEISHTVRIPEAKAKRVPIFEHAPTCTAAVDYRAAAQRIVDRNKA